MTPEDLGFDSARLDRIGALGRSYVDAGKLPGVAVQVGRHGEVVYRDHYGRADIGRDVALAEDAIYRIYSMTKPITSIALMQLYEHGAVLLENPVEKYIPELAAMQVWAGGTQQAPQTRPATRSITVRDLLTHTSGLTYGFFWQHPLDALYRDDGLGDFNLPDYTLADAMGRLGTKPLLFDPGASWNYSMSTDVVGRIVEVVSGTTLDRYFAEHILDPLGMGDTGFSVPESEAARLGANYIRTPGGSLTEVDSATRSTFLREPIFLSGGGGLVSTVADYQRFCDMLLGGGTLDGVRIIGSKTLQYMTTNHLRDGLTLNDLGQSTFAEAAMEGTGFGLGFSVIVDPAANGSVCSPGEFGWGGAASTAFWIDPVERMSVIFMTQFMPSNYYPIRRQLRAVVNQALID